MQAIGGYFGLELSTQNKVTLFEKYVKLNSGRHALEYILCEMECLPSKIYLPYYTCEVVLEPLERLKIPYSFYRINDELEIAEYPDLCKNECIIVNNYFGIKDEYVDSLHKIYGKSLIIDDAQALFHPNINGTKAFYSPRKFVGIPDGGLAFTTNRKNILLDVDYSTDRSIHLFRRLDSGAESGYKEFKQNSEELRHSPMRSMSKLTQMLINGIDFEVVIEKRKANYRFLEEMLGAYNLMRLPNMDSFACPMVYPFLTDIPDLRQELISNKIFVATYWPNVFEWCDSNTTEYNLAKHLLPLPIDQRYDTRDMERISTVVSNIFSKL